MTPLQLQCRYCETYKAALSRIFPASPEVMGKLFRCCSQVICINVRWEKRFMAEESWHCCHKCLKTRQGEVWGCRKLWAFRITGIFNAPASGQSLFVPCCDNFPPIKVLTDPVGWESDRVHVPLSRKASHNLQQYHIYYNKGLHQA